MLERVCSRRLIAREEESEKENPTKGYDWFILTAAMLARVCSSRLITGEESDSSPVVAVLCRSALTSPLVAGDLTSDLALEKGFKGVSSSLDGSAMLFLAAAMLERVCSRRLIAREEESEKENPTKGYDWFILTAAMLARVC